MRKRTGRKLLVATLGVAAVSYVACTSSVPPPPGSPPPVACTSSVANLMAPPQDGGADTAADTSADSTRDTFPLDLVANLVAPR